MHDRSIHPRTHPGCAGAVPHQCRSAPRPPPGSCVHEVRWPAARYTAAFPPFPVVVGEARHRTQGSQAAARKGSRRGSHSHSDRMRDQWPGRRAQGSEAPDKVRRRRGHPQPDSQVIQTEGIGQGQSITPRLGRLRGVKDLVKNHAATSKPKTTLLSERLTNTAKMSTWASAFTNCPLYMAPTPGNETQKTGQNRVGMHAGQPGAVPAEDRRAARQGSQKTLPPTERVQAGHSGLPQL